MAPIRRKYSLRSEGRPQSGGQFPGQRPGQGMPMMALRQINSLDIPASTLQVALALSDVQTTKVAEIQKRFHAQFGPGGSGGSGLGGQGGQFGGQGGQPGQGGPGFGGPGGQGGQPGQGGQGFGGASGQGGQPGQSGQGFGGPGGQQGGPGGQFGVSRLEQQAIRSIYALLTDTQKELLPTVLKQFDVFPMAGIPPEAAVTLRLANVQREKIASIVDAAQQTMRNTMDEARASGEFESVGAVCRSLLKRFNSRPWPC